MLTAMTDDEWALVLKVFRECQSRRGDKGRDDRLFLEAMHFFVVFPRLLYKARARINFGTGENEGTRYLPTRAAED